MALTQVVCEAYACASMGACPREKHRSGRPARIPPFANYSLYMYGAVNIKFSTYLRPHAPGAN